MCCNSSFRIAASVSFGLSCGWITRLRLRKKRDGYTDRGPPCSLWPRRTLQPGRGCDAATPCCNSVLVRWGAGGYFRDQALALQAAGWKMAILAPSLWTLRDARRENRSLWQATSIIAEQDALPVYRRQLPVVLPRMPHRDPLTWALGGMKLFERYADQSGLPHLVHARCCLNAGVLALLINRRHAIPCIVAEQSTRPDVR
jgi:hypothetical protein